MRINHQHLVNYLVFVSIFFWNTILYSSSNAFLIDLRSKRIKTFYNSDSVLTISKNSSNKFDYFYKRGPFEVRIFNNKESSLIFIRKSGISSSTILGKFFDLNSKKSFVSIFQFLNGTRNYKELICEKNNTISYMLKIENEFSNLVENIPVVDETSLFDKDSCSGFKNKKQVVGSLIKAVTDSNVSFKSCLLGSDEVHSKLTNNDEFRRIMISYYSNALQFAKGFFVGKNQIQFVCDNKYEKAKIEIGPSDGKSPHKLYFNPKEYSGAFLREDRSNLAIEFNKVIMHELDHIFFQIPAVNNASYCEHEYKGTIIKACSSLASFNIPNCIGSTALPDTAIESSNDRIPDGNEGPIAGLGTPDATRSSEASGTHGTGVPPVNGMPKPLAASSIDAQADKASPLQVENDGSAVQTNEVSLTTAHRANVSRSLGELFGSPESGNFRVRENTEFLFRLNNPNAESQLAGAIASQFETKLPVFDGIATGIKAMLGEKAVAETIATGSGLASQASNWAPAKAIQSYLSGNPNTSSFETSTKKLAVSGSSTANSRLVAAASQQIVVTSETGIIGNKGADTNGVKAIIAGKISSSGSGISAVANESRIGVQKTLTVASNDAKEIKQPISNSDSIPANNPFLPQNNGEGFIKDTPELRLLATPNVTISGATYQAIRKNYNLKDFRDDLKVLGYSIEVLDAKGTFLKRIGFDPSENNSRPPASAGIQGENSIEKPKIIFIDNGTTIKRKSP